MSSPDPSREYESGHDNYDKEENARVEGRLNRKDNKVQKKTDKAARIKKAMAKRMFKSHGDIMQVMTKNLRSNWLKKGPGGQGDLPPGRTDKDNE